jgi:hypothetical protein
MTSVDLMIKFCEIVSVRFKVFKFAFSSFFSQIILNQIALFL